MKLISLDIDGVLTNYPACWLSYLNDASGTRFSTTTEAKGALGEKVYEAYKNAYRTSDYKATLPLKEGSASFLLELQKSGYDFVIATSRPPLSRPATEKWLAFHNIPYQALIEKKLDSSFPKAVQDVLLHVDDELPYVELLRTHDLSAWHLENNEYKAILDALL